MMTSENIECIYLLNTKFLILENILQIITNQKFMFIVKPEFYFL